MIFALKSLKLRNKGIQGNRIAVKIHFVFNRDTENEVRNFRLLQSFLISSGIAVTLNAAALNK